MKTEVRAYIWGILGIIGFGLTLPATKAAVPMFLVLAIVLGSVYFGRKGVLKKQLQVHRL